MADAPRSPAGGGDAKRPPSRIGAPPPARPLGSLPANKLPEANAGVVVGASTTSPAPAGDRSKLPTLAPPRRKDGETKTPATAAPKTVAADDIDIELDSLFVDTAEEEERTTNYVVKLPTRGELPPSLPAICAYGRYEVLGRIAFGGMAEIFLGREATALGASRHLVIKRILPHVADDAQFVEMFLDEARLAIQLSHPNICHIYEFGELEGSYFIAMEWINGVPLGKLIKRARGNGGVPPEIAVRVMAQVAEALHYAHRARDALGRPMGIVHRDVTPHNIMVAYDGNVKLLDFGIAKASSHTTKTEAGVVKGKFSYMAPEQCLGRAVDARADVFAIGICLYEALTGEPLYHKDNEYETMRAVIHDPVPPLRSKRPDLPDSLDAIVQRALKKKADERFQTAGELQLALETWLSEQKKMVNAGNVAAVMERLYEDQIKRGPLVDSTPFGASFQRMRPSGISQSLPAIAAVSQTTASVVAPARRAVWPLFVGAALLVVVGLGAGYVLFNRPEEAPPHEVAAMPPIDPRATARAPEAQPTQEPTVDAPSEEVGERPVSVGSVRVESTPPGATVRIGDRAAEGQTPLTVLQLAPGTHHVVVERAGFETWEGDVEVAPDQEASAIAALRPITRAPARPPGRISINTRPWSKVYVGGRLLGTTPIAEANVPSGSVRLRLVDRDGETHARTVRVGPGASERVFYDLQAE
jgi:eukaryotic-like serine/threonine-protein kinase